MSSQFQTYDFSKNSRIIINNSQSPILEITADKTADLKIIEKISWNFKKPYNINWCDVDQFNDLLDEVFTNDNTAAESIQNIGDEIQISSFINDENASAVIDPRSPSLCFLTETEFSTSS